MNNLTVNERSVKFIGHFLSWYQQSFSLPDVVNNIKLIELVKEAEVIHTCRIKELELQLEDKAFKIRSKKRIHKRIRKSL